MATEINGVTNYLHIADTDRGRTYVDTTPQDLRIVINDDHTRYRFYRTNSDHSLDLFDNTSTHGFGTYNGNRDYEFFTLYELGPEIRPHVTVHFVNRDGSPLEDVQYTGENSSFVTKNADGTFEIPYNWKGTSGTVNLETEFSLPGYTYANAHLAKTSTDSHWTGSNYNQNGLVIDSTFTSNGLQSSRILPIFADLRASSTAPTSDWLITIEGPPDWAMTMFIFFIAAILYQKRRGKSAAPPKRAT